MNDTFSVPHYISGIALVIFAGLVILGGIKWIGRVTAFFVPFMAAFYILAGGIVMVMNINLVPEALGIRSEEHTSELQSRGHLVCRLLLAKEKRRYTGLTL